MTPKAILDDILTHGIQEDLFRAEQCFALLEGIGEHAERINQASFGELFGNLQQICLRLAMLSVAKVFEKASSDYSMRTLPVALTHLRNHAADLEIVNPHDVIKTLVEFGHKAEETTQLPPTQLTTVLYTEYNTRLPKPDKTSDNLLCRTLYAIKTIRDKAISHAEHINVADLPETSSEGTIGLIQFAQGFLQTVGRGYLSVSYTDSVGEFMKTTNAARARISLDRLLKTPGLLGEQSTKSP